MNNNRTNYRCGLGKLIVTTRNRLACLFLTFNSFFLYSVNVFFPFTLMSPSCSRKTVGVHVTSINTQMDSFEMKR